MNVRLVGTGAAAEAVADALGDVDATVDRRGREDVDGIEDAALGVVTAPTGDGIFERANRAALAGGTPWIAVESGGLGGYDLADVEAAVTGFTAGPGCYECLRTRVGAGLEGSAAGSGNGEPASARLAGAIAGREIARLLDGGNGESSRKRGVESGLLGGVIEVASGPRAYPSRGFLPVPGCSTCGRGRDRTLSISWADRSLEEALAAAERALDERVGVVSEVGEAESYPAPYYLASLADTSGFSDAQAAPQSAGVDADWNPAFMKALGEGLERYCAGVYKAEEFAYGPSEGIEGAVPPERFVSASAVEEPIPWVEGAELGEKDGESTVAHEAWLPAELVHFPPPERKFDHHITTGLGLGNSTVEAVLSGLYEVIERDATMIGWYSTFEPLGLAVEDEGYRTLERRARSEDLEATALLVTQDVDVPVVAAAVHREGDGEGEWPRFAMGSGASLDPTDAARSALAEALQNWMELRAMGREAAAGESGAVARYAEFPEIVREFVTPETVVPADSVGPAEPPEGKAELAAVVERVGDVGLDVYAARLTTPDVASLGFEGVRVLVPKAQPLFTGEPVFGERARTVPEEMGYEARLERELHPYP